MSTSEHPLVHQLAQLGVRFHHFAIEHESPHRWEDWDWNQRDLLHVPYVHGGFEAAVVEVGDDRVTAVSLQRLFGFRVPLLNAYTHASAQRRAYVTTLGPFTLLVEASLTPLDAGGTRVRTAYSVGSLRPFTVLHRFIERVLRRNYQRVHDEDEPLRRRRSELRAWGYRFRGDDEGSGYRRSTALGVDRVQPPSLEVPSARVRLDALQPGGQVLVGRSDSVGLRVVREGERVVVYPRLCPHEGACLDVPRADGDGPTCPWHARKVEPVCSFQLGDASAPCVTTAHHELRLEAGELLVGPRRPGAATSAG